MRVLGALALAFLVSLVRADDPSNDLRAKVDERLRQWWTRPDEKKFDEIAWAPDLASARELAARHQRPVFLFTMDGRVNTGRC